MSYTTQTILCNKKNYGTKRGKTQFLVIHYTANNGDTAISNGNYFKNNIVKSSAHYFVDKTMVVSSVPEDYIAWHVGASKYYNDCRNNNSIGIELCSRKDSKGKYYFEDAVVANAIELTKQLMKKYNIKVDNVVRHFDTTHKNCPAPFVENETAWKNFLSKLVDTSPKATKSRVNLQQWGSAFENIERIDYIPMTGPKGSTVSLDATTYTWNGRYPDAICNAELFNMTTYKPSSGVVHDNIQDLLTDTLGFSFVDNKKPVLSYKNNLKTKDWIGAYPMLLRDGKIAFSSVPTGLTGKSARTALAINDTTCAIVYVKATDACTLEDFANAIKERGFHTAINLDGGGSTACVTPGVAYDQGRKVRGKIGIWVKNGVGNKLAKNPPIIQNIKKVKINTPRGLNLRKMPETGRILEVLPKNSLHSWNGEEKTINNVKWYYIKSSITNQEGWINSNFIILI